jgi:hypothetical protein
MFWDVFIRRVFAALGDAHPHGPPTAFRALALAYLHRLFDPAQLQDVSILLLALLCPPGTALRARADAVFRDRGLHLPANRPQVLAALRAASPTRPTDWLPLLHQGTPHQRGLVADLLLRAFAPRLAVFLGRVHLADPVTERAAAVQAVVRALGRFSRIPPGTIDFACYLYRRVLRDLPVPASPPPTAPALATLPQAERQFLGGCVRHLGWAERVGVGLVHYAGLDVRQIACVLSATRPWGVDAVIRRLGQCWETVLNALPLTPGLNGD